MIIVLHTSAHYNSNNTLYRRSFNVIYTSLLLEMIIEKLIFIHQVFSVCILLFHVASLSHTSIFNVNTKQNILIKNKTFSSDSHRSIFMWNILKYVVMKDSKLITSFKLLFVKLHSFYNFLKMNNVLVQVADTSYF